MAKNRNFTHIDDTEFPYPDTINPYKYENNFDYSQYDKTQMRITVCAVPWDVGLIHVGNAQIGGLGNVVYFESKEARDEWLDSIEDKFTWETNYREYHTGGHIKVPLPYEKAVLYNYCFVEYTKLPVDYAEGGKDRFFFFIRECASEAPSTCDITILRDTFQTFIYDVHVNYLMLERGHAPMALMDADTYLENPIENNSYLLAEDVNYSTSYKRKYASNIVLNSSDMWAVVVSSGNPSASWGSKLDNTWSTPDGNVLLDGQPAMHAIALNPSDLSQFLDNIDAQAPQFKQTIKGVFFVAQDLVELAGPAFSFCGVDVRRIRQKTSTKNLIQLTKNQFGFGPDYENLAKLYTYPYSYLEISDENGDVTQIKIEETSGNLSLTVTTSLAYPWLTLDGRLSGVGSGSAEITFSNVNEHTFNIAGNWYDHLYRWNIPSFAVIQSASIAYDYETHFDRAQRALENTTNYNNASDNASTSKANADASAATAKTNADDNAATAKTNADANADTAQTNSNNSALTTRDNSNASAATAKANSDAIATTSKTNADANTNTAYGNAYRDAQAARNKFTMERNLASDHVDLLTSTGGGFGYQGFIGESAWANITKVSDDWDADWLLSYSLLALDIEQAALTSNLNTVSGAAASVVGGATAGLVAGPGGAAVGAASGLVGSAVTIATAAASIPMVAGFTNEIGQANIDCGDAKVSNAIAYARTMANLQSNLEINKYNADNTWLTNIANLVRDTSINDAQDTQATSLANAQRNYDTDTANNLRTYNTAISNNADAYNTEVLNASNSYNTAIANNLRSYNTAIAVAQRTYNTALANNERTYNTALAVATRNKNTADEAIQNDIKQAALQAPKEFGSFNNGENSTTRPQGLFCNIVTQSKDAIEQAGDYFLRFGYAVNRAWRFTTFNVMPRFTYWKASDMWISGNNVPDAYLDEIRFFFLGGVCVWRNPEDIGNISIYDNV